MNLLIGLIACLSIAILLCMGLISVVVYRDEIRGFLRRPRSTHGDVSQTGVAPGSPGGPEDGDTTIVNKLVARQVNVQDARGTTRMILGCEAQGPAIALLDEAGRYLAAIHITSEGVVTFQAAGPKPFNSADWTPKFCSDINKALYGEAPEAPPEG